MGRREKTNRSRGTGDVRAGAASTAATPSPTARRAERSGSRVALAALIVVVVLCYLPALENGFVYDDVPLIIATDTPHGWHEIAGLLTQGHWNNLPYYRPLPRLALGVEKIGFDDAAAGYHLVNALLMGSPPPPRSPSSAFPSCGSRCGSRGSPRRCSPSIRSLPIPSIPRRRGRRR